MRCIGLPSPQSTLQSIHGMPWHQTTWCGRVWLIELGRSIHKTLDMTNYGLYEHKRRSIRYHVSSFYSSAACSRRARSTSLSGIAENTSFIFFLVTNLSARQVTQDATKRASLPDTCSNSRHAWLEHRMQVWLGAAPCPSSILRLSLHVRIIRAPGPREPPTIIPSYQVSLAGQRFPSGSNRDRLSRGGIIPVPTS